MEWRSWSMLVAIFCFIFVDVALGMSKYEKKKLSEKVKGMFNHAYHSYMDHAYPADELMPLSCKGRYRGTSPSRGDIDDSLGNFSLTLVDALDSLVVLGELEEFDKAVRLVIRDVQFDSDIVVSVFETNIRMLGGLLGGHSMAIYLKKKRLAMSWYNNELLEKAKDLGYRLLPAFNTSTGMPYPRVNLRHGVKLGPARTGHERDTCTACAGTMILEFAALSRFTGDTIFEEKARKAMQFLWQQRHRSSDLVGKVINIHNGDWVHRESGVGAGIDSYYEYLIKAYILLGDETYLERFNVHYDAIMKYIWQGPILVDVHMHKPLTNSRNFMDSLLAFWPGVQILKGDLKPAIEMHEMLYQVMQRHNFLPEAFTTDFRVHWGQHPLRPEFIESTYFIYKATGDPYYLEVGRQVVENLEKHARVDCGYAAIKDVTLGTHEDQMDSFFLAETFKYLYLLFAEHQDILINVDDYVFTTEAHLLPLSLSIYSSHFNLTQEAVASASRLPLDDEDDSDRSCPNTHLQFPDVINFATNIRLPLKNMVDSICPKPRSNNRRSRLKAGEFVAGNKNQIEELKRMGIKIVTMKDGRVQLLHTAAEATSPEDAEDGMMFMQEMIELAKQQQSEGGGQADPRVIQLLSPPFLGNEIIHAGPAQFGYDLKNNPGVEGVLVKASPIHACHPPNNADQLAGKIAIVERGECMFIHKARFIQAAGAKAGIVIDHNEGSSSDTVAMFSMSGDGKDDDVTIPLVFIFRAEGMKLLSHLEENQSLQAYIARYSKTSSSVLRDLLEKREVEREVERQARQTDNLQTPGEPEQNTPAPSEASGEDGEEKSEAASEGDRLLHQYLDKLKIGSHKINLKETKVPWSKEAETLLKIIEGPNNNRHVSLQLENLMSDDVDRRIADVYTDLLGLLSKHTNFEDLPGMNVYMKALGALVETIMSNGERGLSEESLNTIERLAEQLQAPSSGDGGAPGGEFPQASYITEEDIIQTMAGPSQPEIEEIIDLKVNDVDQHIASTKPTETPFSSTVDKAADCNSPPGDDSFDKPDGDLDSNASPSFCSNLDADCASNLDPNVLVNTVEPKKRTPNHLYSEQSQRTSSDTSETSESDDTFNLEINEEKKDSEIPASDTADNRAIDDTTNVPDL